MCPVPGKCKMPQAHDSTVTFCKEICRLYEGTNRAEQGKRAATPKTSEADMCRNRKNECSAAKQPQLRQRNSRQKGLVPPEDNALRISTELYRLRNAVVIRHAWPRRFRRQGRRLRPAPHGNDSSAHHFHQSVWSQQFQQAIDFFFAARKLDRDRVR